MPVEIPLRKNGVLGTISGDFPLDENIVKLFGSGRIISAEPHGYSRFTSTGKIVVEYTDEETKKCSLREYFIKVSQNEHEQLLNGEFTTLDKMDSERPGMVPKPLALGRYTNPSSVTFLVEDFIDMDMAWPDADKLVKKTIALHKIGSPTGKFGFPIKTFCGIIPRTNEWEETWPVFFQRLLTWSIETDQDLAGEHPDLAIAGDRVVKVVVPKLLGRLKDIHPVLVHGDLWGGNMGTCKETGNLYFFDAGGFYAHNEYEIGRWRRQFPNSYTEAYKKAFPPAEPHEDFDDRNRLYSLAFDLAISATNPKEGVARGVALNNMIYLCGKYATAEGLPPHNPDIPTRSDTGIRDDGMTAPACG